MTTEEQKLRDRLEKFPQYLEDGFDAIDRGDIRLVDFLRNMNITGERYENNLPTLKEVTFGGDETANCIRFCCNTDEENVTVVGAYRVLRNDNQSEMLDLYYGRDGLPEGYVEYYLYPDMNDVAIDWLRNRSIVINNRNLVQKSCSNAGSDHRLRCECFE